MTKSRNGYNGKSSNRKLVLLSEDSVDFMRELDPHAKVIIMPSGVYNEEKFYSKPELRAISKALGDLDAFTHYNGHYLFIEFKSSTHLQDNEKIQICSQLCLSLDIDATYWIIEWGYSPEERFEVSELIEIAPGGAPSLIKIDVEGLKEMYDDWWDYATDKKNIKSSCKWDQALNIFKQLQARNFTQTLDKRKNKDDDDAEGEITAI